MNRFPESNPNENPEREMREIEADIAETRSAITEDLRTIGDKLSPEQIKEDLKESAAGKVREMKHAAGERVSEKMSEMRGHARDARDKSYDFVRDNVIPLALIGVGAAWLVSNRRKRKEYYWSEPEIEERADVGTVEEPEAVETAPKHRWKSGNGHPLKSAVQGRMHGAVEKTEHRLGETRERAREARQRAREMTRQNVYRAREKSASMLEENPLALGAIALAAGVGIGLMIPETEKERQKLAPARERFVGTAREVAHEVRGAAHDVAHEAKDTASSIGHGSD